MAGDGCVDVAFVTPEVFPFSKTGGLGDVADALPAALGALGADVTVFSPCYRSVLDWMTEAGTQGREIVLPGAIWVGDERCPLRYRLLERDGRRWLFVVHEGFFDRPRIYVDEDGRDFADSVARFAFFCRAVLEYFLWVGRAPGVFHAQDWPAALLPVYLQRLYRQPLLAGSRSVFTIHNLGYQGRFPARDLYATGLGPDVFHPEGLEFYGGLNLLKGGVVFADAVTTVSPTYAMEIQTESLGHGLHGVLRHHAGKLGGILNGVDQARWDPATDQELPAHYGAGDLGGKALCKEHLQRRVGLPARPASFLLGIVSRFDAQKGIPLLVEAFPRLDALDVQIVLLGSGDRAIEEQVRGLAQAMPTRARAVIGFDEALAHLIQAGADAFVMPSVYEPCGLNQMYAQRYGTVPIVRATGGLRDTVVDCNETSLASGEASGFCFEALEPRALEEAIRRAAGLYGADTARWRALVARIMGLDHSWRRSAEAYLDVYQRLLRTA